MSNQKLVTFEEFDIVFSAENKQKMAEDGGIVRVVITSKRQQKYPRSYCMTIMRLTNSRITHVLKRVSRISISDSA